MRRANQQGFTLIETLVGIALVGFTGLMILQIVTIASTTDLKLRARTEAWQTINQLAAPAQHVDCSQMNRPDVCKPEHLSPLDPVTTLGYEVVTNLELDNQHYTHHGLHATYNIEIIDEVHPGADHARRAITVTWRPDGSAQEKIEHTVFGPRPEPWSL